MKKKITAIICCAVVVLCTGLSVAYYNTKSFGFDENTKIASTDDDKITIFDFNIYYNDIDNALKKVQKYMPDNHRTV
ncbi:MAG: hypothetical protein K2G73_07925 [Eubacterium sp.]|nr:hypothetical protein [Eubacterium sp.]